MFFNDQIVKVRYLKECYLPFSNFILIDAVYISWIYVLKN